MIFLIISVIIGSHGLRLSFSSFFSIIPPPRNRNGKLHLSKKRMVLVQEYYLGYLGYQRENS